MATAYSRVVTVSAGLTDAFAYVPANPINGGNFSAPLASYVELPCPPRGILSSLVITQLTGTRTNAVINVYDRAWATDLAFDLNVKDESLSFSGVWMSAFSGGVEYSLLPFGNPAELANGGVFPVGSRFIFKCPSWYGFRSFEAEVVSYSPAMHFVPVVGQSSDYYYPGFPGFTASSGVIQQVPYMPPHSSNSHLVYTANVTAGSLQAFNIGQGYENRDNQSETKRTRHSGLWLDITADDVSTWEVAVTTETDSIV